MSASSISSSLSFLGHAGQIFSRYIGKTAVWREGLTPQNSFPRNSICPVPAAAVRQIQMVPLLPSSCTLTYFYGHEVFCHQLVFSLKTRLVRIFKGTCNVTVISLLLNWHCRLQTDGVGQWDVKCKLSARKYITDTSRCSAITLLCYIKLFWSMFIFPLLEGSRSSTASKDVLL